MATDTDRLLLTLDADITRLTKQMAKAAGETTQQLKKVEHEAEGSMLRLEALFGETKVGEALENVFKRTRFTVLEEGAARIPVFGSALEALGASGLVAAGGLFAFHEAMEKAREAGEWAEGIEQASGRLGVSMEKLQELDFAGASIGLKPEETREALDAVNDLLGKMQAGEPRAKMLMQELSFTPAQVQSIHSVADFIPQLADHLGQAGSAAEQSNIAEKGGFARLLPLLRGGSENMTRLADEARKAGIVLSGETVEAAAKLNGKINEMQALMGGDLRKAFIALMPLATQLTGIMAGLAAEFADGVTQIERLAGVSLPGDIKGQRAELQKRIELLQHPGVGSFMQAGHGDAMAMLTAGGRGQAIGSLQEQLRKLNVDDVLSGLQAKLDEHGHPARTLIDPKEKKPKAAPHDETAEDNKAATDAYETALKEAATASAALVKDIQAHADLEKRAVDDDTAKRIADLNAQELKFKGAQHDANATAQIALIEKAKAETQNAAAAKKELIERQAATAALAKNLELQDQINSTYSQIADIRAALAPSTDQRNAITRKNLLDNQWRERIDFDAKARDQLDANAALPDAQQDHGLASDLNRQRSAMMALQSAQRDQLAQQQESPWDQWMREGVKAGNDVGQTLQSEAVKGITDLNSGLANAIVNGKSMGDVFKSVFRQMEADVLSYLLRQSEVGLFGGGRGLASGLFGSAAPQASANAAGTNTGLLGSLISMLPHFASGTDDAPGGLSLVGEKGPELVNLPNGAGVTPNNVLSSIGKLDPSKFSTGSTTMNHHISIDLTGANGDERIREIAHQAAAAGTLQAISYSNSQLRGVQRAPGRDLTRY